LEGFYLFYKEVIHFNSFIKQGENCKMWKKFFIVIVLTVMCFVNLGTFVFGEEDKSIKKDELVDVIIYKDSETVIIAQVPKSKEQEYLKELENENYKNVEIQKSQGQINENTTGGIRTNDMMSARSKPDVVKYFGKNSVAKTLDAMDKRFNWERALSNPITDAAIGRAVSLVTKNNVIGWATAATIWTAADLRNRQEQWWKDTLVMVVRGQARGAKLEITYNRKSNYPASWVILSRY